MAREPFQCSLSRDGDCWEEKIAQSKSIEPLKLSVREQSRAGLSGPLGGFTLEEGGTSEDHRERLKHWVTMVSQ